MTLGSAPSATPTPTQLGRRAALQYFLVTEILGPEWDRSRPRREQLGWDAHAAFVDSLADQGAVVLG